MSHELETGTRRPLIQVQEDSPAGRPEVAVSPVASLTSLVMSEANKNGLRPFKKVGFATQAGRKVSFNATNSEGKELAERVTTRIFDQFGGQIDWRGLAAQTKALSTTFRPLRKELGAQIEVAQALFSEPVPNSVSIASVGTRFEANLKKFTRESKGGRRQLTASGKRFAEATYQWLGRLFPDASLEELKGIIDENLSGVPQTGLLVQSLKGKINWENRQCQYLVLEQQNPEALFEARYYNELGKELQGAVRFQYELSLAIEKAEEGLGREIEAQAEVETFEAILEAEASDLEKKNEQLMVEVVQEQPQGFREKVRVGWNRFTKWFVKEKGYKTVVLATVTAVSVGMLLATCAGIPQRLVSQGPLLPDRPQSDPRPAGEPKPDLSRAAVSVPQWQPLARTVMPPAEVVIKPLQPRPEFRAAQDEAEKQRFLAMAKDFSAKHQGQDEAGRPVQASQPEPEKAEKERPQETALSAMNQPASRILFEANQGEKEDGSRRQGPPPPMNPTPEPTRAQQEIRAQAEPILIIKGIPHNADLSPDAGVFEAQGTWVNLDEKGQLPDPPKDKVALYDVGFLYGQTPDGRAELVASEGDIHAYIHNAQRWAEAGWPRWKDWLSLAFDQGGIKNGDIIEFGGAKYKVIDIGQADPKAMLGDLFAPTREFLGRRLVISTCSTPPEGVYTSSTDLGLPRQVVTAVLVDQNELA